MIRIILIVKFIPRHILGKTGNFELYASWQQWQKDNEICLTVDFGDIINNFANLKYSKRIF